MRNPCVVKVKRRKSSARTSKTVSVVSQSMGVDVWKLAAFYLSFFFSSFAPLLRTIAPIDFANRSKCVKSDNSLLA